jgi:hypothetical protein
MTTKEIANLKKQISDYNDRIFEASPSPERAEMISIRNKLVRRVGKLALTQLSNSTRSSSVSLEFAEKPRRLTSYLSN